MALLLAAQADSAAAQAVAAEQMPLAQLAVQAGLADLVEAAEAAVLMLLAAQADSAAAQAAAMTDMAAAEQDLAELYLFAKAVP